jgi:hypothetical protein
VINSSFLPFCFYVLAIFSLFGYFHFFVFFFVLSLFLPYFLFFVFIVGFFFFCFLLRFFFFLFLLFSLVFVFSFVFLVCCFCLFLSIFPFYAFMFVFLCIFCFLVILYVFFFLYLFLLGGGLSRDPHVQWTASFKAGPIPWPRGIWSPIFSKRGEFGPGAGNRKNRHRALRRTMLQHLARKALRARPGRPGPVRSGPARPGLAEPDGKTVSTSLKGTRNVDVESLSGLGVGGGSGGLCQRNQNGAFPKTDENKKNKYRITMSKHKVFV